MAGLELGRPTSYTVPLITPDITTAVGGDLLAQHPAVRGMIVAGYSAVQASGAQNPQSESLSPFLTPQEALEMGVVLNRDFVHGLRLSGGKLNLALAGLRLAALAGLTSSLLEDRHPRVSTNLPTTESFVWHEYSVATNARQQLALNHILKNHENSDSIATHLHVRTQHSQMGGILDALQFAMETSPTARIFANIHAVAQGDMVTVALSNGERRGEFDQVSLSPDFRRLETYALAISAVLEYS